MKDILYRQLATDFCLTEAEVRDRENHFARHAYLPGRRRFQEGQECYLKIAVVNGKVLFAGREDILGWCREKYEKDGGEWFFEANNLMDIEERIRRDGYKIETVHPFFIAEEASKVSMGGYELRWIGKEEIEGFRGDDRYDEAFAFCPEAPDVLGVAALRDGEILGMAGASCDSPQMWQIGINVNPECREAGIGTMLVSLIKNEILSRGILPFYGTSMSHLASQRVALGAGFVPAWVELATSKAE